ncbi:MAG: tetratricopeptide repeat protein [Bacteroidales bacterium]|nr:tetratricopeptide repeat protein [Bacteroidales bacterium]
MNKYIITGFLLCVSVSPLWGQIDRRDVRKGNRDFRKENYREADIDYRKALVKDSLSVAANYNLASNLYRQKDMEQAKTTLERIGEVVAEAPQAADYYFNLGDVAIAQQDWQGAVTAFEESLVRNPDDMQAKENYIYARQMLRNQQNQQDQQQNQDNQQNNDQNQDNQNNDDQQDGRNDQDNQDGQDKNDGQQDRQPQQNQGQQPKITPQAAQQMLQAIQAKEKETQDKVNKQKAEALKSRQKDKNW